MELKVNEVALPEKITFNYEELKAELQEKTHVYETIVYDEAQIKEAKTDRARLNSLKKTLNDERIRREKEYMIPFNDFKAKINEIIGIIDKPVAVIDAQVKAFEEKKREAKKAEIEAYYDGLDTPEFLTLDRFFDESWLNATVSMKSIQEAITAKIGQVEMEMNTLKGLPFAFESIEEYKRTLSMNSAITEGQRLADIQRRKEEAEKAEAEAKRMADEFQEKANAEAEAHKKQGYEMPKPEAPVRQWIKFKALLSTEEAHKLRQFMDDNNINFEAI